MEFIDSYARLPARFFTRLDPTPVADPRLIEFNAALALELGLDIKLHSAEWAAIFSGNRLFPGSQPIAMAYAGHQFGHFVPRLGDGRAVLLGEVRDRTGRRWDIQLKGSGRTPYSRSGDGRAAVGPVLREYLVSEAMHALGLPTTRALAAVTTGEAVLRERRVPGAILTRVAASHIRVGTFQYFAAQGDSDATKRLADYVIERHYPAVAATANPYLELLQAVMQCQARLMAGWMNVGFIHGVMNTDNMAISGETIDFGPCAFMDAYDPATVFSSIDHGGRYAYVNQPAAAQWNLARFAETLLPFIDRRGERAIELAAAVLSEFSREFDGYWLAGMRRKLGFFLEDDADTQLANGLLDVMHRGRADFTLTFRRLCAAAENSAADAALDDLFDQPAAFHQWIISWRSRLAREPQPPNEHAALMRMANPAVIPRNHRVEAAIVAGEHGDYRLFAELRRVLSRPYDEQMAMTEYAAAPLPEDRVLQTFCGT